MIREIIRKYIPWRDGERIRAMFLFQAGTVWPSTESVYESCLKDSRFDVRLVLVTEKTLEMSHSAGAKEYLDKHKVKYVLFDEFDWKAFNPHVIFIQFPHDLFSRTAETYSLRFMSSGVRVIYIPYGIEIADTNQAHSLHFATFAVENAWRIYTSSPGIANEYMKYCRNRKAVRTLGSPKFDVLANLEHLCPNSRIIQEKYKRRIVVWKMHFPKKINEEGVLRLLTPDISEYTDFARSVDSYKDIFFVILPHPVMLRNAVASQVKGDYSLAENARKLLSILSDKENVFIDYGDDYRPSLYNADAIIIDRSAVMIEAAMTGVPVLFMQNFTWSEPFTKPVKRVVESFYQGTNADDMRKFVEMVRDGKDPYEERRCNIIHEEFPFMDGKCGERIKKDVVQGVMEPINEKPRIILYAAGEICEYYLDVCDWKNNSLFEILGIADGNQNRWMYDFCGYKIIPPTEIANFDFDAVVIMSEEFYFEIKKHLVYDLFIDERKVWRLDEFVLQLDAEVAR